MIWRALVVAVLAVTAGCGSFATASDPTPTVTPAPVPTASPTPDEPRGAVAPGLRATGVTDPGRLARSHVEAASGTSYVWRSSTAASHQFRNSTVDTSESQMVAAGNGSTYHRTVDQYETMLDGEVRRLDDYEEYVDGTVIYRKWSSDDGRTVRENVTTNDSGRYAPIAAQRIRRYLALDAASVSRVDVGEGAHYEVVGTRETLPRFGSLDSYRARAVVRADGFVKRLDVRFHVRRNDERIDVRYNFTYERVGETTVSEPDWIDEADGRPGDD